MSLRLRGFDLRQSRLPSLLGLCAADSSSVYRYVNAAERRLLMCREAGEESWWGTWAEMAFLFTTPAPPTTCNLVGFLTPPRNVARVEYLDVCQRSIPLNNQFYEYLQFGNGRMPKIFRHQRSPIQGYTRNNVPTFIDMTNPPQFIAAFVTNPADAGNTRALVQGLDPSGNIIYSQDGLNQVTGQFEVLQSPFVQWPTPFSQITGIQKDVTQGQVQFFQVDPTTGAMILLLTMEPGETTAWYRRYVITPLPVNCCFSPNTSLCGLGPPAVPQAIPNTVTVTCIVKLEKIDIVADTDYTLLQNQEAIIEECQGIRYLEMDVPDKHQKYSAHHQNAVRLLNGELTHYMGLDQPAVQVAPFGSARLYRRRIGTMV